MTGKWDITDLINELCSDLAEIFVRIFNEENCGLKELENKSQSILDDKL